MTAPTLLGAATMDDGVGIFVRRIGEGPRIWFSHGAGFACDAFGPLVRALARDHSVFLVDLRGHGVNPPLQGIEQFSIDAMVGDVRRVRDFIDATCGAAPMVAVCHSISGVVALRAMQAWPNLFTGFIGFEPPLAQPDETQALSHIDQQVFTERALRRTGRFERIDDLADRYRRSGLIAPDAARELAQALLRPHPTGGFTLRCPPEIEAEIYRTNHHFGLWPRLAELPCPALIMAGRRAGVSDYTADVAPQIAARSGFDLIQMAGLSHLGWIEAPQRSALLIKACLDMWRGEAG